MKYKKYITLVAGLVFLVVAAVFISQDKPEIYIVFLVLGFMFFFQGVHRLRKKR